MTLTYKIGKILGYRKGFHYGYDNNPLKYSVSMVIYDIKFLIQHIEMTEDKQVMIKKLIKKITDLEKNLNDEKSKKKKTFKVF